MEGIINGNLLRAECAHDPEHGCITTWSSGAAEQIEALARCNETERRAGVDSLHKLARPLPPKWHARLWLRLEATPGDEPEGVALRMAEIADRLDIAVEVSFNGIVMLAMPGAPAESVLAGYEAQRDARRDEAA